MAYKPAEHNYLPYDWSGVVTANDIAIQNRPFSLGQHLGPTPEQAAQKELEDWFRARGLDPNRYYEGTATAVPQPGFNPAGGAVNQGRPLRQQTIYSGGLTKEQAKALEERNAEFEKLNELTFDRKAALANPGTRIAMTLTPAAVNYRASLGITHQDQIQIPNPNAPAPNAAVAPVPSAPLPTTAAPKTFLPPYLQPGAPTDANNITGAKLPVATQIASPTPIAPPITPFTPLMPQGFAMPRPVTPGLFPNMAGVPRVGGFSGGFGATAKLLELPQYLRNFGGINYGR